LDEGRGRDNRLTRFVKQSIHAVLDILANLLLSFLDRVHIAAHCESALEWKKGKKESSQCTKCGDANVVSNYIPEHIL